MFIQNIAPVIIRNWVDGMLIEWPFLKKEWSESGWRLLDATSFEEFPPPVVIGCARYVLQGRPCMASFSQAGTPSMPSAPSGSAEQPSPPFAHMTNSACGMRPVSPSKSHHSLQSSDEVST
jgi:hypothetical protein